jgi:DNA-binding response OmpR family regulator
MIKKEINILICEDEFIIALDLKNNINRLGYNVTSIVRTGEELLQKTGEDNPDIIISDIGLKGKSTSLDALETISLSKKIPIIFISGLENAVDITRKFSIDPCYHITKPYLPGNLKETIEACISGKSDSTV